MLTPGLTKLSRRYLLHHPLQTGLTLVGIMLGVAIVVAIDLANYSAKRAFELSMEITGGNASHFIKGGNEGIPEDLYRSLRIDLGIRNSSPLVSDEIFLQDRRLTLIGTDLFAQSFAGTAGATFTSALFSGNTNVSLATNQGRRLLLEPNTIAITNSDAEQLGIAVGDSLTLVYRSRTHEVIVAATFNADHPAARGIVVTDIAVAQELLDRIGKLDRIDLALEEAGTIAMLERWLPPGLVLRASDSQLEAMSQMTRAFHTNLTAMSLLALLVGGFLIYNTMMFMVLRRRSQFGAMRSLGVSDREMFTMVLSEALLLGLIATIAGLVAGIALAQTLVQIQSVTINDLYYRTHVNDLFVSNFSLAKGFLLGLFTTLLAAWLPSRNAANTAPVALLQRSTLERSTRRYLPWLFIAGIMIIGAGWWLAQLPIRHIVPGFVAMALVIIGFSFTVPLLVKWLSKIAALAITKRNSPIVKLGIRGIMAGLSRNGLAIASLTIAVATTLGVGIMISSFRITVADWLEQSLNSDVYVTLAGSSSEHIGPGLPTTLIEELRQHPGVKFAWASRTFRASTDVGTVRLMAIQYDPRHGRGFNFKEGNVAAARAAFNAGEGLLISEPYAYHHQLSVGDTVTFRAPGGPAALPVLGIFIDYTSEQGMAIMPLEQYQRLWQDQGVSSLGLFRTKETEEAELAEAVSEVVSNYDAAIRVSANSEIRAMSMTIFDRTFTITHVLQLLAIVVAFIGVLSALMALQLEKTREFALLRATGVTPTETGTMVLIQTLLMGLFAGILSVPLGYMMSTLLIEVINVRSFGWTMQQVVSPTAVFQAIALAIAAALAAGIYPALRAARMPVASSLREE